MVPDATPAVRSKHPERIGRYTIVERIGKGAMGLVYSAMDERLQRPVALKVLVADLEGEPDIQARFYREAKLVVQLQHRNIVTVLDSGEEDGRLFFAMELLRGATLGDYLRANPATDLERKLDLMTQVCEGLAAAHARGVYHRDIKPGNLFVQNDGSLKLLDFGIARLANSSLTSAGLLLGTPDFMSPEQARGEEVDGRSDLFSAAAVFYLMLTGRKPFEAPDLPGILHKVGCCDPPPPSREEAPPELWRIISKALSKNPANRYQRVPELLVDLIRFHRTYDAETRRRGQAAAATAADLRDRRAEYEALVQSLRLEPRPAPAPDPLLPWHEKYPQLAERGDRALGALYLRRGDVDAIATAVEKERARTLSELSRLQAANRDAVAAVGLEPGDPRRALQLYERARQACRESRLLQDGAERCRDGAARQEHLERESDGLRASAQEAVDRRDWEAALGACEQGLLLRPHHPSLLRLREAARIGRDAQERARRTEVQGLTAQARQAVAANRFDAARVLLGRLESLGMNGADLAALKLEMTEAEVRSSAATLAQTTRQFIALGRAALRSGDAVRARSAAETVLAMDPGHAEAPDLLRAASAALTARDGNDPRGEADPDDTLSMVLTPSVRHRVRHQARAAARSMGAAMERAVRRTQELARRTRSH